MRLQDRIPHLVLAPCERIRFHENPERHRTLRLVDRLRADRFLCNPPIVACLNASDYVLLDGANRVSAFRELGLSHIPVQVVDYSSPQVILKGWHHLLQEGHTLDLRAAFSALPGVRLQAVERDGLDALIELRRVMAVLVDETTTCWGLFSTRGDGPLELLDWIDVLGQVVKRYEGRTGLERIKLADHAHLPAVFRHLQHQLVLFPALTKVELLQLVEAAVLIPTGISRHSIPGRALGLNIDLRFLSELDDTAAKEAHLREHVADLDRRGRIRFYEESTFIMNE